MALMQGIGLEVPLGTIRVAHGLLLGGVALLAVVLPRSSVRWFCLAVGATLILFAPLMWVAPLLTDGDGFIGFTRGFYISLMLSLAIPFCTASLALLYAGRLHSPVKPAARGLLVAGAYVVGFFLAVPVSLNGALLP